MTRLFRILGPIPFFLFACGTTPTPAASEPANSPAPAASADCPAASEPCMNEDNLAVCLSVAKKCPGKVVQLESCPLQFACGE